MRARITAIISVPIIVFFSSYFYAEFSLPSGGSYAYVLILAMVIGITVYMCSLLGEWYLGDQTVANKAILVIALGTVIGGHSIQYGDTMDFIYRLVQNDEKGRFPAEWKSLPQEDVIPLMIELHTGTARDGILGYLTFQAAVGWEGQEGRYRHNYVVRTGFWVWFAWFMHIILFLIAGFAGLGGTIPKKEDEKDAGSRPPDRSRGQASPG